MLDFVRNERLYNKQSVFRGKDSKRERERRRKREKERKTKKERDSDRNRITYTIRDEIENKRRLHGIHFEERHIKKERKTINRRTDRQTDRDKIRKYCMEYISI